MRFIALTSSMTSVRAIAVTEIYSYNPSARCHVLVLLLLLQVCHHGNCQEKNNQQPIMLCQSCDHNIHTDTEYSGHLRFDVFKQGACVSQCVRQCVRVYTVTPGLILSHGHVHDLIRNFRVCNNLMLHMHYDLHVDTFIYGGDFCLL